MPSDLSSFGFECPPGLTRVKQGEYTRADKGDCGCRLVDHEFHETCDWQCQGCGKLTPNGEWNLIAEPIWRTVCNECKAGWDNNTKGFPRAPGIYITTGASDAK